MIWIKTETGRAELKARTLTLSAAARNLLLVIDGAKSEELLLKYTVGVTAEDFRLLHRLGLIEAAPGQTAAPALPQRSQANFAAALSAAASAHLGLAGTAWIGTIERARTLEQLVTIARLVMEEIRVRRGDAAADQVRSNLFRSGS